MRVCGAITTLILAALCLPAEAQSYKILYSFPSYPGSFPTSPSSALVRDRTGNLYGSTFWSGDLKCQSQGCGEVFRLSSSGKLTVLHAFSGTDGLGPDGGLVLGRKNTLYGTADAGGDINCNSGAGCGTVFKIDAHGKFTLLYSFTGPDGNTPTHNLLLDKSGNVFGSTTIGGSSNEGVIFEVASNGTESVLENFSGANGAQPSTTLIAESNGDLLGSTAFGGAYNMGTIFSLTPGGGGWTGNTLYNFGAVSNDGFAPVWGLVLGADGSYYGTTGGGGAYNNSQCVYGCGTIFKVTPGNGQWAETILYNFTGGTDGSGPQGVVRDGSGNLYGVASYGGDPTCACGVIFQWDTMAGKFAVLHTFKGKDGSVPIAPLLYDKAKKVLYRTTSFGGSHNGGTVFEIAP